MIFCHVFPSFKRCSYISDLSQCTACSGCLACYRSTLLSQVLACSLAFCLPGYYKALHTVVSSSYTYKFELLSLYDTICYFMAARLGTSFVGLSCPWYSQQMSEETHFYCFNLFPHGSVTHQMYVLRPSCVTCALSLLFVRKPCKLIRAFFATALYFRT